MEMLPERFVEIGRVVRPVVEHAAAVAKVHNHPPEEVVVDILAQDGCPCDDSIRRQVMLEVREDGRLGRHRTRHAVQEVVERHAVEFRARRR